LQQLLLRHGTKEMGLKMMGFYKHIHNTVIYIYAYNIYIYIISVIINYIHIYHLSLYVYPKSMPDSQPGHHFLLPAACPGSSTFSPTERPQRPQLIRCQRVTPETCCAPSFAKLVNILYPLVN
jgi:hypothetical protein